mmetsp:Transcript_19093/g.52523  ORF Transcript_19093/g.52523 Transcript_19093/m.52523 type:complete len:202 (-) Transcript_19093:375-980(-)
MGRVPRLVRAQVPRAGAPPQRHDLERTRPAGRKHGPCQRQRARPILHLPACGQAAVADNQDEHRQRFVGAALELRGVFGRLQGRRLHRIRGVGQRPNEVGQHARQCFFAERPILSEPVRLRADIDPEPLWWGPGDSAGSSCRGGVGGDLPAGADIAQGAPHRASDRAAAPQGKLGFGAQRSLVRHQSVAAAQSFHSQRYWA